MSLTNQYQSHRPPGRLVVLVVVCVCGCVCAHTQYERLHIPERF